jgi:hypothetical protein
MGVAVWPIEEKRSQQKKFSVKKYGGRPSHPDHEIKVRPYSESQRRIILNAADSCLV